jgi:hypothetical protein
MKRSIATLAVVVGALALSGCYYDPDYSYVRSSGSQGDVYYGRSAPVYEDSYYAAPGYYNTYGCCYAPGVSIGVSRTWYGGSGYYPRSRGHWHRDSGYRGDRRPAYRSDAHRWQDQRGQDRRGQGRRGDDHRRNDQRDGRGDHESDRRGGDQRHHRDRDHRG